MTPDERQAVNRFIDAGWHSGYIRLKVTVVPTKSGDIEALNFQVNIFGCWITLMWSPLQEQPLNSP